LKQLSQGNVREIHGFNEERQMPYVTSIERLARQEGAREELLAIIRAVLKAKFG
jgi:hypothetical protein